MTDGARPPGSGRTAAMRRRLRSMATERLGYKAAALFFALVLWLVVSTEEPAEQVVPVRLSLELDPAIELRGERPQLRALVAGRGRTLLGLFDSPPVIRRGFGANVPDSVRIVVRPGDIELPPGIEATVRDVQPRSVLLRFRRVELSDAEEAAPVLDESALVAQPDALPADSASLADSTEVVPATPTTRGPSADPDLEAAGIAPPVAGGNVRAGAPTRENVGGSAAVRAGARGGSPPAAGPPPQGNDTAASAAARNRGTARRTLPTPRERSP